MFLVVHWCLLMPPEPLEWPHVVGIFLSNEPHPLEPPKATTPTLSVHLLPCHWYEQVCQDLLSRSLPSSTATVPSLLETAPATSRRTLFLSLSLKT